MNDAKRELFRHTLATLAYRGGKALRAAPAGFAEFRAGQGSRTAGEILAHIGDLLDWGLALAEGRKEWRESPTLDWEAGAARFFTALAVWDAWLAQGAEPACTLESLLQGPVADAFTHVGQISLLRRLAGSPVKAENYQRAEVVIGRVGPEQTPPKREF